MSDQTNSNYKNICKIIFGVSLAFNLVIVGALGGLMLRSGKGKIAKRLAPSGLYLRALSPQDRRKFGREIRKQGSGIKQDKAWEKGSYASAIELLKSDAFDKGSFRLLLEKQTDYVKLRRDFVRMALIDHMSEMTLEERMAYAKRLTDLID